MTYATPEGLIARYPQEDLEKGTHLDEAGTVGIDPDVLQKACDAANGICDGWLSLRYSLPLTTASTQLLAAIASHAEAIAYANLTQADKDSPAWLAHERAIEWLKALANGSDPDTVPGAGGDTPTHRIAFQISSGQCCTDGRYRRWR